MMLGGRGLGCEKGGEVSGWFLYKRGGGVREGGGLQDWGDGGDEGGEERRHCGLVGGWVSVGRVSVGWFMGSASWW